jgi:hypothetical protein
MWTRGKGALAVLIHGTLCDYRHWGLQLGVLGKAHRVIARELAALLPRAMGRDRHRRHRGRTHRRHGAPLLRRWEQSRSTCSDILAAALWPSVRRDNGRISCGR